MHFWQRNAVFIWGMGALPSIIGHNLFYTYWNDTFKMVISLTGPRDENAGSLWISNLLHTAPNEGHSHTWMHVALLIGSLSWSRLLLENSVETWLPTPHVGHTHTWMHIALLIGSLSCSRLSVENSVGTWLVIIKRDLEYEEIRSSHVYRLHLYFWYGSWANDALQIWNWIAG